MTPALVNEPANLPKLPAVQEFIQHIGFTPPQTRIAALTFDKLDVEKGMEVREVETWKESAAFPGYIWLSKAVKDIWFDRPKEELIGVMKEIENGTT